MLPALSCYFIPGNDGQGGRTRDSCLTSRFSGLAENGVERGMHSCLLSTCYLPVTRNVHITSVLAHRRGVRVRGFQITHRKSQPAGKEGRMPKVVLGSSLLSASRQMWEPRIRLKGSPKIPQLVSGRAG